MKTKTILCGFNPQNQRDRAGHSFVEGLIAITVLLMLVVALVAVCASPLVGKLALWGGFIDQPLTFKDSVRLTIEGIVGLFWFAILAFLLIELPASVLNLHLGGLRRESRFESAWKLAGHAYYAPRTRKIRQSFRAFAVVASLALGYWFATTFTFARVLPSFVFVVASMVGLAPVAWLYAALGFTFPPLRRLMTERTVFVPISSVASSTGHR